MLANYPVAHFGVDNEFFNESETAIANPYVGFEFRRPGTSSFIELGGRVPLAPDDKLGALLYGTFADINRLGAFAPDLLTVTGKFNYYNENASNLIVRLRGGSTVLIPTDEGDTELVLDYSAQVGYKGSQISVIGGLSGQLIVTEEDLDLGERTIHQLGASASLNLGSVRPGIHFWIPMDEDLDFIDFVLGLNLVLQLR